MIRRPPISTRTDTLFPYTTLFRSEVVTAVFPGTKPDAKVQKVVPIARARARQGKGRETSVPIKGLIPGMAVHYAHCCHPLPGDRIVGIVNTGKGVTVDRKSTRLNSSH